MDCQVAEAAFVTTLTTYKPGMAAVLMINSTDNTSIKYNQRSVINHERGREREIEKI